MLRLKWVKHEKKQTKNKQINKQKTRRLTEFVIVVLCNTQKHIHFILSRNLSKWSYWEQLAVHSQRKFNSLRGSDCIWQHKSGSVMIWLMVYCLVALSHYLNQCWYITTDVLSPSCEGDCKLSGQNNVLSKYCKKFFLKYQPYITMTKLPSVNLVNMSSYDALYIQIQVSSI